ncbi:aminoglycoside phosphotransferase family protein [Streptomyces otsuchiensis]|uniref:aminoglycoside phosphotransferase family protein n=1 Tax=Streptomyces otsuchiensis TaxID=2681388 RepID=UPI001D1316A9|nr:aminoglycoside phosphotransferase family protein [Streptomyces otsuchiensis]
MTGSLPLLPPPRLVETQKRSGDGWVARLPERCAALLERWELTAERVVEPGGRSGMVVLAHRADSTPAALKLRRPGGGAAREDEALRLWDGWGAVRVLRADHGAAALLLERAHGEVSLRSLPEAKAALEATSVLHRLWRDPGEHHAFPTVASRTRDQAEGLRAGRLPDVPGLDAVVAEALAVRERLLAEDPGERFLLHGDFRQGAVLASRDDRAQWLAAGPHPVVGERAYDLARLVRDRLHDLVASPGAAAVTRRRVARLAEATDVDPERLRGWAAFRAVESGVRGYREERRADGEALLEFSTWLRRG